MKFGIGQPVRRHEDLRLITGRGRYTDDVTLPRMTHAVVARSSLAHAHIKRVDAAGARRIPGVLFVATGEDIRADGLGDLPCVTPLATCDGTLRRGRCWQSARYAMSVSRSPWSSPRPRPQPAMPPKRSVLNMSRCPQ